MVISHNPQGQRKLSNNQLNEQLKLMVETPKYVIYSNMPPYTRVVGLEVWIQPDPSHT